MNNLFGEEHSACTTIWQGLFIDETDPTSKSFKKKKKKLGWLERLVSELGIDRIRNSIIYTWDKGLLDEHGRPIYSTYGYIDR
jgi:hypothetical protein